MARGYKTGGRKKGTPNKLNRELLSKLGSDTEVMPLEFLLRVMRDENEQSAIRFEAAKAAAPYVHARFIATDVNVNHSGSVAHEHRAISETLGWVSDVLGAGQASASPKPVLN